MAFEVILNKLIFIYTYKTYNKQSWQIILFHFITFRLLAAWMQSEIKMSKINRFKDFAKVHVIFKLIFVFMINIIIFFYQFVKEYHRHIFCPSICNKLPLNIAHTEINGIQANLKTNILKKILSNILSKSTYK